MKILFIGTGHMGSAILKAIMHNNKSKKEVYILNNALEKSQRLSSQYNCNFLSNWEHINEHKFDIIIIGVRPVDSNQVLSDLNHIIKYETLIISMVNALSIEQIAQYFNLNHSIIRMIPNMNATNFASTTSYAHNNINIEKINIGLGLIASAGNIYQIDEAQFPTFVALTGCSPAYIFTFVQAFIEFGVQNGFNYDFAKKFVTETIVNSVTNLNTNNEPIPNLIEQICVPNGSTIEGQKVLNEQNFASIIKAALLAAKNKS